MADFEDFTKPRVGKPAAAGASFDDFVPERPTETPKPSYPKRALGAAASLADLIVSLPGFVMGTAADAGSRLVGTLAQPWSGESRRDVAQGGLRASERTMHLFGNPFQKLVAGLEGGAEAYEGSTPAVLMQKLSGLLESGGEKLERATGGAVLKEDLVSMANQAMLAGPPAVGAGWRALKGKPPVPTASTRADLLRERGQERNVEILEKQAKTPEKTLQDFLDETLAAQARLTGKARKTRQGDLEAAFTQGRVEPEAAADPRNAGASAADIAGRLEAEAPMLEKAAAESRAAAADSWLTDQAKRRGLAVGGAGAAAAALAAAQDDSSDAVAAMAALGLPLAARKRGAFLTRPKTAQDFAAWVKDQPALREASEFVEPAAGKGDILQHFPGAKGYDIAPLADGIEKADFLKKSLGYKPGRVFVGNPPFGQNSNLARQFVEKALAEGDYAAFILPPGFKGAPAKGLKGELVAEAALPGSRNFYYPGAGDLGPIRATAQLWKRSDKPYGEQLATTVPPGQANVFVPRVITSTRAGGKASVTPQVNSHALKATPEERQRLLAYDWTKGLNTSGVNLGRHSITLRDVKEVMQGRDPYNIKKIGAGAAALGALAASQDDAGDLAPGLAMFLPLAVKGNRVRAAEAMKAAGKTREQIWQDLGAWQGPDGKWRGEISDAGAKLKTEGLTKSTYTPGDVSVPMFGQRKLADVVDHPELFAERPDLREVPVGAEGFEFGRKGSFEPDTGKIRLAGGKPEDVLSVALHEVMHKIQRDAGLARGGSPGEFLPERFKENLRELDLLIQEKAGVLARKTGEPISVDVLANAAELMAKGQNKFASPAFQKAQRLLQHPDAATLLDAVRLKKTFEGAAGRSYGQYKRLAGEAEARLVQARQAMTPEERRATPPWKMLDVPEESLIVKEQGDRPAAGLDAAVKEPGGLWHPEAMERLAEAFQFGGRTERAALGAMRNGIDELRRLGKDTSGAEALYTRYEDNAKRHAWAEKSIRNYLNRYAGTTRDPLKDTQVPFRAGTERWEDLTDLAFGKAAEPERVPGAKPGETVWDLEHASEGTIRQAREAIQSYLAHIGDYLRQNVPLEKLSQYDFVRAARETAANDARVAKEMERAATASMKDLPVYKEYPDGMRWVELKAPEELTPEQARGVARKGDVGFRGKDEDGYVALDEKGEPIKNSYTGDFAEGPTPQEAFLAGQLAREGNQMGHCVGGYCADVARGDTRILSLRDAKGRSHVTVEVEPREGLSAEGRRELREELGREPTKEELADAALGYGKVADNILQIKGKQNRAPNKEYLPYVQDLVKSGKWGEVKDLGNTGLYDTRDPRRQEFLRGKRNIDPEKLARYMTREELQQAVDAAETGPPNPRLLAALAIGGGAALLAALNDEPTDSTAGAMAAGLFGLGVARKGGIRAGADNLLGAVSTRIRNADPALLKTSRDFEMGLQKRKYEAKELGDPFLVQLNKTPKALRGELERAIVSNEPKAIEAAIRATGNGLLDRYWQQMRKALDDIGQELKAAGIVPKLRDEYFPRIVKDVEGLFAAIGKPAATELQKRLIEADAKAVNSRGSGLTQLEESQIINQYLLEPLRQGHKPSWAKNRGVKEVTADLMQYYLNPTDAFHAYVNSTAMQLEKGKFFGKDAVWAKQGPGKYINTEASIGATVRRMLDEGKIDHSQMAELDRILRARFGPGERSSYGWLQDFRNITTGVLLGNPVSAVLNLTDVATTARIHGVWPTVKGLAKVLTPGAKHLELKDLYFADHISEEFVSTRKSAKFLNGMMKWGVFSWVDKLMKEGNLEAARMNYERLAQTPKGISRIGEKYADYFGKDFEGLVKDLQAKQLTDRTRALIFAELSDIQPMTKLEVPLMYLENPNGRTLYQFKSFMLKQLDQMRREGYEEIKKGNTRKGTMNLVKIATVLGASGASVEMLKDFLLGRPFDAEWEDIPLNTMKTFGLSQYVLDKARSGKPLEAAAGMTTPPYKIFDDIIRQDPRATRYIPIIGKVLDEEAWTEAGAKRQAERKLKKDLRKINREVGPMFGKPTELQREEIRDRRLMLRELRGVAK